MTAEEKTALACFLDTASDYLGDGYARSPAVYEFKDDPEAEPAPPPEVFRPLAMVIAEDTPDKPFAENARRLMDKMLASISLFPQKNCIIAVMPNEAAASGIHAQIEELKPLALLCMGDLAVTHINKEIIPVISSYHPGDILKDESLKRPVWENLKALRAKLSSLDEAYAVMTGDVNAVS